MRSCRTAACRRSREDRRSKSIALAIAAVAILLACLALANPALRSGAGQALASAAAQGKKEFMPEVDTSHLVVSLLDFSLDSVPFREKIADQQTALVSGLADPPALALFRFASATEYIGAPVGSDLVRTLRTQYKEAPIPKVPDTHLALALTAAEAKFAEHLQRHPGSRLTLLIGSGGGVEDSDEAAKVASRLAAMGVKCIAYGGAARLGSASDGAKVDGVQLRTIEVMRKSLAPLAAKSQLAIVTQNDFGSQSGQLIEWISAPAPAAPAAPAPAPQKAASA